MKLTENSSNIRAGYDLIGFARFAEAVLVQQLQQRTVFLLFLDGICNSLNLAKLGALAFRYDKRFVLRHFRHEHVWLLALTTAPLAC